MKRTSLVTLVLTAGLAAQPARAQKLGSCDTVRVQVTVPECGAQRLPPPPPPAPPPPPVVRPSVSAPVAPAVRKPPHRYLMRIGLGLDFLPVSVDLALSDRLSLDLSFFLVAHEDGPGTNYYGGVMGGLDYYVTRGNLQGLFVGFRAGFVELGTWGEDHDEPLRWILARAIVGYTWIWDAFFLTLETGFQYINIKDPSTAEYASGDCWDDCGDGHTGAHMLLPHASLRLGVAF